MGYYKALQPTHNRDSKRRRERERQKGIKNVFEEIMAENFPSPKKETDIKVQEAQRVPNKMNPNRPTPRHIIIKTAKGKDKERILKAAREKQKVSYKGTPIKPEGSSTIYSSPERGKSCNLGYSTLQDYHLKQKEIEYLRQAKLKEFSNTKPTLKEILKGLL